MTNQLFKKLIFLHSMGIRYFYFRVRCLFRLPRVSFERYIVAFDGIGLEIGGPSTVFVAGNLFPVYEYAQRVDNVTFSDRTRWEGNVIAGNTFVFNPRKQPGHQFVLEGSDLSTLAEASYDFVLSCHMLEHSANPLRALYEWKRLLKSEGKLLLVLPHKDRTFDHRRPVTRLAHLVEDFELNRSEDDTTHLQEILELHDLSRDPQHASFADFEKWIRENGKNRGAHHHVFDIDVSVQMLSQAGFKVLDVEAAMPYHIFLLAVKPTEEAMVAPSVLTANRFEPVRSVR